MDFKKGSVAVTHSCLVLQFKDQILLKQLKFDYFFEISKKLAPIRMQKSAYTYGRKEWIYVTNEKSGSKVRLLSFVAGIEDPTSTLYSDKSNKILSLIKLDDSKFIIIDDTFTVRTFEMEYKDVVLPTSWK